MAVGRSHRSWAGRKPMWASIMMPTSGPMYSRIAETLLASSSAVWGGDEPLSVCCPA